MCGIAGRNPIRSAEGRPGAIDRPVSLMASRGPQGNGIWTSGPLALGHRRLSIIDLSPRGTSPWWTPTSGWPGVQRII